MKAHFLLNFFTIATLVLTACRAEAPISTMETTQPNPVAQSLDEAAWQSDLRCGGTFPAIGDASVDSNSPDTPYGDGLTLAIYKGEGVGEAHGLLLFDLAGDVPAEARIFSAVLELPIHESGEPYPYRLEVYNLEGEFGEMSVTWNNHPALGNQFARIDTTLDEDVLRIDVTAMVILWLQGMTPQSLAILPGSTTNLALNSKESGDGPRLFIDCVRPFEPIPLDLTERDLKQATAIQRLQEESAIPVTLKLGLGGSMRFAHFDFALPVEAGQDRLEQAQWFMDRYRDLFRLDEPRTEMQLVRRSEDGEHLFFRQRVNGIPVFPSETVLYLSGDSITGIGGAYVPDIRHSTTPLIGAEVAERLALDAAGEGEILGMTQLNYVNLGLLGFDDESTHLAWRVNAAGAEAGGMYYIDAENGKVLLYLPHAIESFNLALYTGNNDGPHRGWPCWDGWFITADDQWYDENGTHSDWPDPPPNPDAEGQRAFNFITTIYNYFKDTFGRDSFDNKGAEIRAYVHVGVDFRNASYSLSCDIFQFGDGMVANDSMAHEFTHAITHRTADFFPIYQSGALDESFSDIFAHFVDDGDWTIGEDDVGGPDRDMQDPAVNGFPDRMSDYRDIETDRGGVHVNSTIHSKAAYLIIQGDTFNGWTVRGIGNDKAGRLFYDVLTRWLWKHAQMIDARNAAVWAAYNFYQHGLYDFNQDDVCQVRNAFAAVELGSGDRDCDLQEDTIDEDDDNDGVVDSIDNCRLIPNGSQSDTDSDGIGNRCDDDKDGDTINDVPPEDNCPLVANPGQDDTNENGIGDACEDSDGDGVSDEIDNCTSVYNPDQHNQDKNNLGDACDPDRDGDTVNNELDNCPDHANADQWNKDKDKYGNACDLCPRKASEDNGDNDNDGLGNPCDDDDDNDDKKDNLDNCPLVKNADQLDTDGNGIGYACDANERNGVFDPTKKTGELRFPNTISPWSISIPVCSGCAGEYLPLGFGVKVRIETGIGVRGRIVNSEGMPVVTRAISQEGVLELTFYPVPNAGIQGYAPQLNLTSSEGPVMFKPDQIGYWLQLFPLEQSNLSITYPISIQVSNVSYSIYLPLLKR